MQSGSRLALRLRLPRRRLALGAGEEPDQPLQYLRQLVAGHVLHDARSDARVAPASAADEDVDAVHDLAVHPDLAALEPDVGGMVVAARCGAAGPAHGDGTRL